MTITPDQQHSEQRHYLDYAATAPFRPEVLEAMMPWFGGLDGGNFGNANTLYQEGKAARLALEEARASIAAAIGATPPEIIFTSGGTEANNAVIFGITAALRERKGKDKCGNRLISSAIEHHAVLEPLKRLKRDDWKITLLKPDRDGYISPESLALELQGGEDKKGTVLSCLERTDCGFVKNGIQDKKEPSPFCPLVSVMAANNEIGTVQPIRELATLAHEHGALFHSDAVQVLGKLPFNVRELGVDAASFSAHKLGGPIGVGAIYLRSLTPFSPLIWGGGQEGKKRSGTQNVAAAVGFAKALELALSEQEAEAARLSNLRDHLAAELLKLDPRISLTIDPRLSLPHLSRGTGLPHLPNLLSFIVDGWESESLILALDSAGIAVSGGSACSTGSLEPSHVLTAIGMPKTKAQGVLRISLGHASTEADADALIRGLKQILERV
jgi:cysteine desulfurase